MTRASSATSTTLPSTGPTVVALQRAMARGELDPSTDVDMAMHVIQGPLISMRIVDNREVSDAELDLMVDMTLRALGVAPAG